MSFVPVYILILAFTIIIDYYAGIVIEQASARRKKHFLILSLIANIGVLVIFKYYNFFNFNITALLSGFNVHNPLPYLSILLPIGLSFHTFQSMSYTIEVYRGNQKAERNFGIFSLYVLFYPQLVAGPIERPQNLLHQFYEKHNFDYKRVTEGLKLMAWGFFKKVVIADRLSILVDNVYNDPYHHHGLAFVIATVFFSFQIFCDFSGYSDMAIGAARVMGFKLMSNFKSPYHAISVSDFWTRWHISLSTWFKDYLYIPLGGNRVSAGRLCLNIFIVFVISGLWHGANWTFLVWGALHAFYLIFAIATKNTRGFINKAIGLSGVLYRAIQVTTTFILVTFAWLFFRAKSMAVAWYIVKSIIYESSRDITNIVKHRPSTLNLGLMTNDLIVSLLCIMLLETVHIIQSQTNLHTLISKQPVQVRWAVYFIFLFATVLFGVSSNKQFIYFQF